MMWTAAWRARGRNRGVDVDSRRAMPKRPEGSSDFELREADCGDARLKSGEPVTKIGGRSYSAWLGLVPPLRWALIATERRG